MAGSNALNPACSVEAWWQVNVVGREPRRLALADRDHGDPADGDQRRRLTGTPAERPARTELPHRRIGGGIMTNTVSRARRRSRSCSPSAAEATTAAPTAAAVDGAGEAGAPRHAARRTARRSSSASDARRRERRSVSRRDRRRTCAPRDADGDDVTLTYAWTRERPRGAARVRRSGRGRRRDDRVELKVVAKDGRRGERADDARRRRDRRGRTRDRGHHLRSARAA